MRDILFRGRRTDNKEWAYGYLVQNKNYAVIVQQIRKSALKFKLEVHRVSIETVGQYTGVDDINGVKIFERSIIKCQSWLEFNIKSQVYYDPSKAGFYICGDRREYTLDQVMNIEVVDN